MNTLKSLFVVLTLAIFAGCNSDSDDRGPNPSGISPEVVAWSYSPAYVAPGPSFTTSFLGSLWVECIPHGGRCLRADIYFGSDHFQGIYALVNGQYRPLEESMLRLYEDEDNLTHGGALYIELYGSNPGSPYAGSSYIFMTDAWFLVKSRWTDHTEWVPAHRMGEGCTLVTFMCKG